MRRKETIVPTRDNPKLVFRVRNMFNLPVDEGEINTKPSLTVPDQSMTVQEIMTRHVRGIPTTGEKIPIYENPQDFDDIMPDPAKMDLADREEFARLAKEEIEETKTKQQRKKEDKEAQQKAEAEAKNNPPKPGSEQPSNTQLEQLELPINNDPKPGK